MNITIIAKRWERGWELWLDGEPVTQTSTLDKAEQQLRDYLDTVEPDTDHTNYRFTITPDFDDKGTLAADIAAVRSATTAAAQAQAQAAARYREMVHMLRHRGLSVVDTATLLGISRGRVSQLTKAG